MSKAANTIPISELQQDAATALKRVRKSKGPLVVTRGGKAAAVILSLDAYRRGEEEREILRLLARGEKEIATGKGFDLDDVLAEADALVSKM
ncbi:MAG TPA: type II toxin-antitoxin system Phd/YefM family antitoxin [Candidatus Binatia bacterium]|jgi:prevent-host-death family protein